MTFVWESHIILELIKITKLLKSHTFIKSICIDAIVIKTDDEREYK